MSDSNKRKNLPEGASQDRHHKRSKGGNSGKWKTPSHKAKLEALKARGRMIAVGDTGFWVSCQRGKEQRSLEELVAICDEYGEKLYGIKAAAVDDGGKEGDDIEAMIQKEVEALKSEAQTPDDDAPFRPIRVHMDCLLFMKTKAPVEPRELVRRMCEDARAASGRAASGRDERKSKFLNRLTPITLIGKASEAGVEQVAKSVLPEHFQMADASDETQDGQEKGYSYGIRLSSRAHSVLKRDDVIKQIASLIGPCHKVNLTSPDKVVIVELFQTFCGMSVVDGDYEEMKRYNLNELYLMSPPNTREVEGDTEKASE